MCTFVMSHTSGLHHALVRGARQRSKVPNRDGTARRRLAV